jgi:hypothetical protein
MNERSDEPDDTQFGEVAQRLHLWIIASRMYHRPYIFG